MGKLSRGMAAETFAALRGRADGLDRFDSLAEAIAFGAADNTVGSDLVARVAVGGVAGFTHEYDIGRRWRQIGSIQGRASVRPEVSGEAISPNGVELKGEEGPAGAGFGRAGTLERAVSGGRGESLEAGREDALASRFQL